MLEVEPTAQRRRTATGSGRYGKEGRSRRRRRASPYFQQGSFASFNTVLHNCKAIFTRTWLNSSNSMYISYVRQFFSSLLQLDFSISLVIPLFLTIVAVSGS